MSLHILWFLLLLGFHADLRHYRWLGCRYLLLLLLRLAYPLCWGDTHHHWRRYVRSLKSSWRSWDLGHPCLWLSSSEGVLTYSLSLNASFTGWSSYILSMDWLPWGVSSRATRFAAADSFLQMVSLSRYNIASLVPLLVRSCFNSLSWSDSVG